MRSLLVAILALASLSVSSSVNAQAPDPLSFQGFVTDLEGTPLSNPSISMTFKLYEGSSLVWTEIHTSVEIVEGIFNVLLGSVAPLDTVRFNRSLSLGIQVGATAEISPRTPLAAAAYAKALPGLYTVYRDYGWSRGYNVIGGSPNNVVSAGVTSATIGGGGGWANGDRPNTVLDFFGTVGGGFSNTAGKSATVGGGTVNAAIGDGATVGGGSSNAASGLRATVGGGLRNTASGDQATVPGGLENRASGDYSFAAGYDAKAEHNGSFVWNDRSIVSDLDSLVTTGSNQFLIRAAGGVGVGTNQPGADLHIAANSGTKPHILLQETQTSDYARLRLKNDSNVEYWDVAAGGTNNTVLNFYTDQGRNNVMSLRATGTPVVMYNGATLTDGGTWTNSSTARRKTDFVEIDPRSLLEGLAALPVQQWRYKVESENVHHIGPTAEDFHETFGLGESTETIGTVDADGVALAAIQGLYELVQELQAENQQMRAAMVRAGIE